MTDLPQPHVLPLHVSTFSLFGPAGEAFPISSPSIASYNWPAEKQGIYIPVTIPWPYPVQRVWWVNGTTPTGNMDFGIYSIDLARIYHTGSTAQSGGSVPQYVTPSTPFILSPGSYYFFLANDSATTTNRGFGSSTVTANEGRLAGMLQQASAFPAPESGTGAAWASSGLPLCGVTRTASGF